LEYNQACGEFNDVYFSKAVLRDRNYMEKHYTLLKAAELLGVTTQTLRNWDNAGKIKAIRTPGNQRRIPESEIARIMGYNVNEIVKDGYEPQRLAAEMQEIYKEAPEKAEVIIDKVIELPSIIVNKDNYLLMCKDTAVYDITESTILDENLLPGCMLKGIMDFPQWMETRYSKDTNFSSQRLMLRAFGKSDYEHAAYATGALSLSDCYRIKQHGEDVGFMDISPYIHKEWDGMEVSGVQNEYIWGSLSNLFVSGKTDKRWLDGQKLLKVNSFREIEPYTLCTALGLENTTNAQKTDEGITLDNFTSTDYFYESMEQSGVADESKDLRDIAVESFKELAVALFVIDYLVENNDRHPDDYGFLRSANSGEYISMAPYYNFDWAWSGNVIALPDSAWQGYRGYIQNLCRRAISVAGNFGYGTIIERRASELLRI